MERRNFLGSSLAASGALLATYRNTVAALQDAPTKRVGLIGTGWYGKADLFRLLQVAPVEVVSLCDVDSKMVTEAADMVKERQKSGNRPRTYGDYRKMLAEKDLDIVLIATPDHWHALPMIEAVKAGADIYVQKPISVDVVEGQAMLAAARKYKRVVQVGTQRRSTPHLIEAKKNIIDAGLLGKISHAEIYCYYHMRARENPPDQAPPENLDYEMWTYGSQFQRRYLCRQKLQGEHIRHSNGHLSVSRAKRRLDASHLGRCTRSCVSVGRDPLR